MAEIIGKLLFTQEDITKRAKEVAKQIDEDFKGEEVVLLATMKGSVLWLADIMKYCNIETKLDFLSASSYGSALTSSGVVKINYEATLNLYNENVIIVEDIIDTGTTLKYVMEKLEERGPKTLKVCSMLNKESRRTTDIHADYVGFEVDDLFVVGYGLDFDQRLRGLPYISYLESEDIEKL